MNIKLKQLFLFFLVLLPVLIFLFLKIFGENEYKVPTYDVGLDSCTMAGSIPNSDESSISVLSLVKEIDTPYHMAQIGRITEKYGDRIVFSHLAINKFSGEADMMELKVCLGISDYLLSEDDPANLIEDDWLILVDKTGRVRGYYHYPELEEFDRLMIELDILIKYD